MNRQLYSFVDNNLRNHATLTSSGLNPLETSKIALHRNWDPEDEDDVEEGDIFEDEDDDY